MMGDLHEYKVEGPSPTTLKGRHVTLVPYDKEKHLDDLWQLLGGAENINEFIRYFPNNTYTRVDELGDWLEGAQTRSGDIRFVVLKNPTDEVMGMASYLRPDPKNGVIEVGCVAHGPGMSRSPMSTEMHYLMAKHVFEDLRYRRYEWKCHNENEPSKKTALRYGFTFEGVFRQHMISRGSNRDTAWFSMIDTEWPLLKTGFEAWLSSDNFDSEGNQIRRLEDVRKQLSRPAVP